MVTQKQNNWSYVVPAASMLRPVWGGGGGVLFHYRGVLFSIKRVWHTYVLYKFMCIVQLKRGSTNPPPPPPAYAPDAAQHAHAIKRAYRGLALHLQIDMLRHFNCGNLCCFCLAWHIFCMSRTQSFYNAALHDLCKTPDISGRS